MSRIRMTAVSLGLAAVAGAGYIGVYHGEKISD